MLKGDYETAERAKQEAEEKQMLLFSKKKSGALLGSNTSSCISETRAPWPRVANAGTD